MRQTVTGTKNKAETMIKNNTSTISENQSKENQTSDKVSVCTKEDKNQKINRFIKQTEEDLKKFQQEQENERTIIKTKQHVNLFQDYIKETEDESTPIHEIDPEILDHYLSAFFVGIRKKDGSEYEPCYLKNIQCSLERHLRNENYEYSITKDSMFYESRQCLQAKQKDLKKQGKGWGPKTADPIEDKEDKIVYETNQLGHSTPDSIINSLWWNLTTHLGMRVNTEHVNLRWGDITLKSDMFGHGYLEFVKERQTKTRTGADVNVVRKTNTKIFATNDENCPVKLYKLYA